MGTLREATLKALMSLEKINPALTVLLGEFGLDKVLEATTPEAREAAIKHFRTMAFLLYTYATELQQRLIQGGGNLRVLTPCLNNPEGWLTATAEGAKKAFSAND
jgi:hypothetical protein